MCGKAFERAKEEGKLAMIDGESVYPLHCQTALCVVVKRSSSLYVFLTHRYLAEAFNIAVSIFLKF